MQVTMAFPLSASQSKAVPLHFQPFSSKPPSRTVSGQWDLGCYRIQFDSSENVLAKAEVTFIKRKGTFEAKLVWEEETRNISSEKAITFLTASPPKLEIYVEHTYLAFTVHIYPPGKRPRSLAEKYADFLPGFGRELLEDKSSRMNYFLDWVEESIDRRDFLWSLVELSKRDDTRKDERIRKIAANAALLINRLESFAEADLSRAQLSSARLADSIFDGANVSHTDISSADLSQSSLDGADFRGCHCENLKFGTLPTLQAKGEIGTIALSPDQRLLAYCQVTESKSGSLIDIWDLKTNVSLPLVQLGSMALSLTFSSHGCIALGDDQGKVHLWKEQDKSGSFSAIGSYKLSENPITNLKFPQSNATQLIIGDKQGLGYLLDILGKKIIRLPFKSFHSICFSQASPLMAISHDDGKLKLWDIEQGKIVHEWPIHDTTALYAKAHLKRFSRDGKLIATLCDAKLSFWNLAGQKLREIELDRGIAFSPFCLSADFNFIVYHNRSGMWIQRLDRGKQIRKLDSASRTITQVQNLILSKDEKLLVGTEWKKIFLWTMSFSNQEDWDQEPGPSVFHFTSQNKLLLASRDYSSLIASAQNTLKKFNVTPIKMPIYPWLFSPDGSLLIGISSIQIGNYSSRFDTVILRGGKMSWRPPLEDTRLDRNLAFLSIFKERMISPDNRLLAAHLRDKGETMEIWDIQSKTRLYSYVPENHEGSKGNWTGFSFTSDGKSLILSLSLIDKKNTEIVLWDLERDQKRVLFVIDRELHLLSISESDSIFIFREIVDEKWFVLIWDAVQKTALHTFDGMSAAYNEPKKLIAKGSSEALFICQREGSELTLLSGLNSDPPSCVTDIQFSPDGKKLAARIVPTYNSSDYKPDRFSRLTPAFHAHLATLYLWEIETVPYLHTRLIDKLPHELSARGAKFNRQNGLSNVVRRILIEKGAEINNA